MINRWHKKFTYRGQAGLYLPLPFTEEEQAEGFACFDTEDYQEGVRAFLAKEKPIFKGK